MLVARQVDMIYFFIAPLVLLDSTAVDLCENYGYIKGPVTSTHHQLFQRGSSLSQAGYVHVRYFICGINIGICLRCGF